MLLKDFYTITKSEAEDSVISADVEINQEHEIFSGHFPNMPVVPGVCQVQMTKEILAKTLNKSLKLTSANNIKFLAVINPKETKNLHFELKYTEEAGQVKTQSVISHDGKIFFKFKGSFLISE